MVKARSIQKIGGGVRILDYRGTGLCPPNGGIIRPLIAVEHIPVIRNVAGVGDLITLGQVLKAQGLAVQSGTDAEGNVALYTTLNALCYHARGANQISTGTEHMHYGINEPWTERQCRAAAWLYVRQRRRLGIPTARGTIANGGGNTVRVITRGHVSHQAQSAAAGYNDRSDPGPAYPWAHVRRLARFYAERGTFRNAPTR